MDKIKLEELDFELLSENNLPEAFNCGDADLNDFVLNDALNHQFQNVAATTLVFYNDQVVAFFSLAADCISLDPDERNKHLASQRFRYTEYPAIKIVRLGIRFISVDAYHQSERFYKKLGFLHNLHKNEKSSHTISMRRDIQPVTFAE